MKKITAFLVSLVMLVTTFSVGAADVSRTSELSDVLYGDTVNIVYNGRLMEQGDVEPQNVDGRVMIPFRTVLENLGATVEYSESDRKVTAAKGDTKINFTLMDDTIYIDSNGEKSEITMDVPMMVKNDRTLVPIRFMSSALGMEVGWDSEANAVVIIDEAALVEEFKKIAPNFTKILDMEQIAYNREDGVLQLKTEGKGENLNFLVDLDAKVSASMDANAYGINLTFDFKLNGGGETVDIDNGVLDVVLTEDKLYLKTDALKKAAESIDSPELNEVAAIILPDTWYSVDLNRVFDAMLTSDSEKELFKKLINLGIKKDDMKLEIADLIPVDDIMLSSAETLATYIDVIEIIDNYLEVTVGEDGAYAVNIKITIKDIMEMVNAISPEYARVSDEELEEIYNMIKLTIEAKSEADKTSLKSTGFIDGSLSIMGESITLKLNIEHNAEISEKPEDVTVPTDSTDVTDLIVGEGETV